MCSDPLKDVHCFLASVEKKCSICIWTRSPVCFPFFPLLGRSLAGAIDENCVQKDGEVGEDRSMWSVGYEHPLMNLRIFLRFPT